jgi:Zn-dependent protease/predicted transcriptional regulator
MGGKGIPFGRIFGISLRLNPSWFIIFILVTWALAGSYFPTTYPVWTLTEKVAAGVITSLLFFASVLAHELMHSVVAQRQGTKVKSITLFIFGGVSEITEEPKKPSDEFRMAIAGPLTSLVLGGAFYALWFGLKSTAASGEFIGAIAYWLGYINLSLGAFNLIPGFPLDGGRVLRSILWGRSGNLQSATRTASTVGRVVAYVFIFAGIFMVFTPGWLLNGVWFIFIGWFLDNAAVGSYRQVQLNDLLAGHKVSEAMTRDCVSVPPGVTADHMINEYALTKGQQCFPVMDGEKLEGMVSFDSLRSVAREARRDKTAQQIMTPLAKLKWVSPTDDLTKVLSIMTEDDTAQVPVVDDNKMVGLISREKLLSFIDLQANLGK